MSDSLPIYLLRRLLLAIPTLTAISFVSFILLGAWLSPLWRIGVVECANHKFEKQCSPTYQKVVHDFRLDHGLVSRWWYWVEGLFNGHSSYPTLGYIFRTGAVWPRVWSALAHTAVLIALALLLVVVFSLVLGTISAQRPGRPRDVAVRVLAYSAWSMPAFLLALLLQQLFARLAIAHGFHPLAITGIPGSEAGTGFHFVKDWFQHLLLPVTALAAGFVGAYSRYVRSAMLVSLNAPYTTTARAKGLSERRVMIRHALRNSLIPFVNILALDFGAIFGASLAVDYVYDQHGLASYLVKALFDSDPYEVEPLVVVAAGVVLCSRALADLVTAKLDPRALLA